VKFIHCKDWCGQVLVKENISCREEVCEAHILFTIPLLAMSMLDTAIRIRLGFFTL